MQILSKVADALIFLRAWISDPLRVASLTPSGSTLSNLMVSEIYPENGPVIELGPGTGVFTRALIAKGVSEENLVLIEFGQEFADRLNSQFPNARTLQMDAAKLSGITPFDGVLAGAVVSGLPLLSMRPKKVLAIVAGAFTHLRADGAFYQFTYGPRCPIPRPLLDRLGLKATFIGRTCANVPPAAVYRISRRVPRRAPAKNFTWNSARQVL